MYSLKAFATNSALIRNEIGVDSSLGEITTRALTFARNKGQYTSPDNSNISLISFTSAMDSQPIAVPDLYSAHALDLAAYVYAMIASSLNSLTRDQVLQKLARDYATKATNFECGDMVTNGSVNGPAWISWKSLLPNAGNNVIKIWFADANFQNEYDDYEIVIVPPITPLDDFFKPGYDVVANINAITLQSSMANVDVVKRVYPETTLRVETFNFVNPLNTSQLTPVNWYVLVYGNAGNNLDAIYSAFFDYIMANTSHTLAAWKKIFPDIFRRTEFIVLPLWDQYAIPDRTVETGIYSPIALVSRIAALMKTCMPSYPSNHVDSYLAVVSHPYKSLQLAVVAGPDNRNNWNQLGVLFPDYICVPSTSIDFNRMRQPTKDWAFALYDMLLIAETATRYTVLPIGMYRVVRDNVLFISKTINGANFMVAAKSNLITVITGAL